MAETLDLNWITAIPLMIAIPAACTTAVRLADAYADRRALSLARRSGAPIAPMADAIVHAGIRREWLRILKHTMAIAAIASSFLFQSTLEARNVYACIVSAMLALNSILDIRLQRRAMREADTNQAGAHP